MDALTRHEGTPYAGRRDGEEQRDVFTAEIDHGASIIRDTPEGVPPVIAEPVFRVNGSGEHRGGPLHADGAWRWGTGTGLRVARSSIPALMRVLADLMEADTSY